MPSRVVDGGGRSLVRLALVIGISLTITGVSSAQGVTTRQAEPLTVLTGPGPGISFSHPLGVALDTVGSLIIVADTGNHRIRIFDLDGYPIVSYIHKVDSPRGRINGEPKAVAVDRQGTLYVLDALAQYVDVMDLLGNTLGRIVPAELAPASDAAYADSTAPNGNAHLAPVAFALDSHDRLILAVGGVGSRIWGLDEGSREVRWILDGTDEGGDPFASITSLFVDSQGRIYVTDGTRSPAVRVFSPQRKELFGFGNHDVGAENFSLPGGVVATADGRIWVLDVIRQAVKVFDREGGFLGMIGGMGQGKGDLLFPSALATDGEERLYILERVGVRLTTYRINDIKSPLNQPEG